MANLGQKFQQVSELLYAQRSVRGKKERELFRAEVNE